MSRLQAVIVGAGHAGTMAAMEMRQAGFQGRIMLIGDEPHLPYERPPLSKDMLLAADSKPLWLHDIEALRQAQIELGLGRRAIAIDRNNARVAVDRGTPIAYDRLLLATGGVARTLDIPGGELARTLRTLENSRQLQRALSPGMRLAIIGAGVIGLEVASTAAKLGCKVTVLEQQSGPMARSLDQSGQEYVTALHRANGVGIEFGVSVSALERRADGSIAVILGDGSVHEADVVVAGIGLKPEIALARNAGLDVEQGVVVDEFGTTSDAQIHAAGDATSFWHPAHGRHLHWQTWQHAQNHGKAVARNIGGAAAPYAPDFWFWTDQHGKNIQIAGFPTQGSETVLRGTTADEKFAIFHLRDGAVVGATLINNGAMNRPVQAMIRSAASIDPEALADPSVPLQRIVPR